MIPDELLAAQSVTRREAFWRDVLAGERDPDVLVATDGGAIVGFCAVAMPSRDDDADPENHPARAFYARFGLEPDGAERTYEGSGQTGIRLRLALVGGSGSQSAPSSASSLSLRSSPPV